jgi:hypothetical protein
VLGLTDLIADMSGGSAINGALAMAVILRYVRRDLHLPLGSGKVFGVVADSVARRTGFRGDREKHSGVKTNTIPG